MLRYFFFYIIAIGLIQEIIIQQCKLILYNIQDYESVNKLFGKETEVHSKLMVIGLDLFSIGLSSWFGWKLCKGMTIETYKLGEPIIKQNDASNNKFYIIAKGSVSIVKSSDTNVF